MKSNFNLNPIVIVIIAVIAAMVVLRFLMASWILPVHTATDAGSLQAIWMNFGIELALLVVGIVLVWRLIASDRRNYSDENRTAHLKDVALMSGGLVHESRNHIHAMKSHFALVRKRANDPDKVNNSIDKLESLASDLEHLFTDFLTFARPSRDELSELDVNELIHEVIELHAPTMESRNIALRFNPGPNVPMLYLDRLKIRSAISNLIVNAGDAIGSDGAIDVRSRLHGRHVAIEVEDDGCGIAADDQSRIFQSFFTTKSGGTGLGLAIARRTVEDMRGRITVKTELEKGTTFSIELPVNSRLGTTAMLSERNSRKPSLAPQMNINDR